MTNYLKKDEKGKCVPNGKRPTNQNNLKVLRKIAKRLKRFIDENPTLKLTELQHHFCKEIQTGTLSLQKAKIDIAHNIAISKIIDRIAQIINGTNPKNDATNNQLVEDIVSSDDEDAQKSCKEIFKKLSHSDIKVEEKIKLATKLINRLNRCSKNLVPGHSATNKSIGGNQDNPAVINKNTEECTGVDYAEKMAESAKKAGINCQPKSRTNINGHIEYQSSSIDADPKKSYAMIQGYGDLSQKTETMYEKGLRYLEKLHKKSTNIDLSESEDYEKLCDAIDFLEKHDNSRQLYNDLALNASALQHEFNNEYVYKNKP